ncbi:MAG: carbohydrate porin [Alistipes sp.]|nr:carbohydrate porin [Alistipes sp.]
MKRFYILICALLFAGASLSAQESTKSTSTESIEARLAKIEKRNATRDKLRQYIKISGFIQGEYDWTDDREGHLSTGMSSFYLRRLRLTFSGDLYNGKAGKLDYRVYFDLARATQGKISNIKEIKSPLLDMWMRYQPCKEFGIQFGQFKNPVTFEASISPSKYDFIDFSYAVQNLAKMGSNDVAGLNVTARDIGFMLLGGFVHRENYSVINYHVGVLNGSGINEKDNNKSKDVFGRITINPTRDLALAAYYQWGEANLSHFSAEKYAEYGWTGSSKYVPMHRWGGGFNYDGKKAFARGEYIAGLTGKLASEGVYVEAGKRFHLPKNAGMLWAGGMVDYFCRNCFDYIHRDTKNAAIDMRYSVCVGYTPFKYLRVQLAYGLEHRINYAFANSRPFGNSVKLMVTGAF